MRCVKAACHGSGEQSGASSISVTAFVSSVAVGESAGELGD